MGLASIVIKFSITAVYLISLKRSVRESDPRIKKTTVTTLSSGIYRIVTAKRQIKKFVFGIMIPAWFQMFMGHGAL